MRTLTSFSFHMWAIVVGSFLCSERFFSGYSGFPSPQKPTFPNSNSIRNRVDAEPLCGCASATSKLLLLLLLLLLIFLSSSKTNIFKFQFNQESDRRRTTLWMCYLQIIIYLFIYLSIYLQLTKFTKMNVWVYYLYWSNKYPVGPDDPICRVATMKRNQTEINEEKFPVVPNEDER